MTSIDRAPRQVPTNALYVNMLAAQSSIFTEAGVKSAWVTAVSGLSTPGACLFRDMGKTVYLPDPTVPAAAGSQSTIMRKVQLVAGGANGYYGTGNTAGSDHYTGYIKLGGQTYGGGGDPAGAPNGAGPFCFARAN